MRKILIIFLIGLSLLSRGKKSLMAREIERMKFPPIEWKVPEVGREIIRDSVNGAVLFVKEKHNLPLVEITIYVRGGHLYTEPEKRVFCELLAPMLERGGTEKLSSEDFSKSLEYNAIDFSVQENADHYTIKLSCTREVLDTAITLLREAIFYPAFNERIIQIEKNKLKDSWRKQLENPSSALWILIDHIRYRSNSAGSLPNFTLLDGKTKATLKQIHHLFFQPQNMIIGVVGDVTMKEIKEKLKGFKPEYSLQGNLPTVTFGEPPEKGVYFYHLPIPQGYILIQSRCPETILDHAYSVRVMNEILGGGGFTSRIVLKVRNEMGLAYSTYTAVDVFSHPFPPHFYAFSATRADAVQDAINAMFDEIRRIKDEKVSSDDIKIAKESYVNSIVTRYSNDWRFLPRIMYLYLKNMPLDYYSHLANNIDTVSIDGVMNAAKKYLKLDQMSIFIVGDTTRIDILKLKKYGNVKIVDMEVKGI